MNKLRSVGEKRRSTVNELYSKIFNLNSFLNQPNPTIYYNILVPGCYFVLSERINVSRYFIPYDLFMSGYLLRADEMFIERSCMSYLEYLLQF